MVRITSPDAAAVTAAEAVLDIRLSQNSMSFFFPASIISGHVIYKNHYGNADYDLILFFGGYNKIRLKSTNVLVETATLFEYTDNVHSARKGKTHMLRNNNVDLGPMPFPFKHRFPSATDNRSFSLPGGSPSDLAFSNHVHDLPPSFDDKLANFHCSIEYELRAELYMDDCLVTTYTLPVMFIPYTRPIHGTRASPSFHSATDPYTDLSLSSSSSSSSRDAMINNHLDTVLSVGIDLPKEIIPGVPFSFTAWLQLQYVPEYDDNLHDVHVLTLKVASRTSTRTLQHRNSQPQSPQAAVKQEQKHSREQILTLHPTSDPNVPYPSYDITTQRLSYQFQATLSSYYSPSFRSFLISNTFCFEGPVPVVIDGHTMDVPLAGANEVAVLSPVHQPAGGTRKFSAITGGSAAAAAAATRYGVNALPSTYGRT